MVTHHVRQHYISKAYLAAWCDPQSPSTHKPCVWTFPAEGGEPRRRSPDKLFVERDMYTRRIVIPGVLDHRDLRIEAGLSQLEEAFARTRRDFLDQRKPIPLVSEVKLMAFVAAQQWRTPAARDRVRAAWSPVLETMDELQGRMDRVSPEAREALGRASALHRGGGPTMSYDQVRQMVDQPLQETLPVAIAALTPHLAKLRPALLCTDEDPGFITSDDPCVWFDPAAHRRPPFYRAPALMYPTLEITMPLTPRCMLLLSQRGPVGYLDVGPAIVAELNRRTRAFADREFISRSDVADPRWFERGEPPSPNEHWPTLVEVLL